MIEGLVVSSRMREISVFASFLQSRKDRRIYRINFLQDYPKQQYFTNGDKRVCLTISDLFIATISTTIYQMKHETEPVLIVGYVV